MKKAHKKHLPGKTNPKTKRKKCCRLTDPGYDIVFKYVLGDKPVGFTAESIITVADLFKEAADA